MNNNSELLDDFLDSPIGEQNTDTEHIPILDITEYKQIDPRFTRHSYSSIKTLQGCMRKFQLSRLRAQISYEASPESLLTFAFGHAVGDAIPKILENISFDKILFEMYLNWDVPFDAENLKQKKSFLAALQAIRMLQATKEDSEFADYVPAKLSNGEMAAELSFAIEIPGKFGSHFYRGHIDLVLQNIFTGLLTVLENKTSSGTWVNHINYKNSSQAVGYSAVLGAIHPDDTSYEVLYNVYMTKLERYETFPFPKTDYLKALWLKDLMYHIDTIEGLVSTEGNYGIWPQNGEYCGVYGRACEFMDTCHMDTKNLMSNANENDLLDLDRAGDVIEYLYNFNLEELLAGV